MPEYAMENYGKHKVPTLRNVDLRPDQNFVKAIRTMVTSRVLKR